MELVSRPIKSPFKLQLTVTVLAYGFIQRVIYYNMTTEEQAEEQAKKIVRDYQFKLKRVGGYTYDISKQLAIDKVETTIDIIKYHGTDIGSRYSLIYWDKVREAINLL